MKLTQETIKRGDQIIERKIRYDRNIEEHHCRLLESEDTRMVLFHHIQTPFTMFADQTTVTITKGSYTIAYYWRNEPYNLYIWRDREGKYLASYFNIVRNTDMTDETVSFEDLIIDLLVLPTGDTFILDEEELQEPLEQFEGGSVLQALKALKKDIHQFLPNLIAATERNYRHEELSSWLNT